MTLTKMYLGIQFDEKPWSNTKHKKNTELKKVTKNSFEKYFFKLMNNSVFGKTMKIIRNRVDVRLVNNREMAEKL